jgi:hypothetical protein
MPGVDPVTAKTIDPQHAADLYELLDSEHGATYDHQDDTNTAHEWILRGSTPARTSRWHKIYWLVLENEAGEFWGLLYGTGLTESHEDDLPWEETEQLLPLTRLYPHTVTRTEYRKVPA